MSDLPRNGLFINSDGVPFAIFNGSLYQLEPNDDLALAPGYYDENGDAVEKRFDEKFNPHHEPGGSPEGGRFTSGGGSGGSTDDKVTAAKLERHRDRFLNDPYFPKAFPNCNKETTEIVGPPARKYNCAAHAMGDTKRWWWPGGGSGYWPDTSKLDADDTRNDVAAFDALFDDFGGKVIKSKSSWNKVVKGRTKIALYTDDEGVPQHVARLDKDGRWISKMGQDVILKTESLYELEGEFYGHVEKVYSLPTKEWAKLAKQKAFEESEHPRDEHGRWTDAGGGDDGGEFSDQWAAGSVGSAMAETSEAAVIQIKGTLPEIRQQAIDACISIGDSKFEVGVIISRRQEHYDVPGTIKVAVLKGDENAISLPREVKNEFLRQEFHHNHPERAPLSGPDVAAMNDQMAMFAIYAHTVDGGESKGSIPGRDEQHPGVMWTGDVSFTRFLRTYYTDFYGNPNVSRNFFEITVDFFPHGGLEAKLMAENYVLLKGLEANGIVVHEFKPSQWQKEFLEKYKSQIDALSKIATDTAKTEKSRFRLKLVDPDRHDPLGHPLVIG